MRKCEKKSKESFQVFFVFSRQQKVENWVNNYTLVSNESEWILLWILAIFTFQCEEFSLVCFQTDFILF